MISKIKEYAWIFLIVALAITGYMTWYFYKQWKAEQQKSNLISSSKIGFRDSVVLRYKDLAGNNHIKASADKNVFSSTTISNNENVSLGGADTAAMAANIQREQIESWKQIALSTKAELLKASVIIDSLKDKIFFYDNGHLNIVYRPKDSTFSYFNNEQLTVLQYWKRNWLLGPKHSFIDISSNDPNTTIEGLKTLTIVPEAPHFNIEGQVRASYDFASGNIIPSAGVQVSVGNLDFSGRYYYSRVYQKLTPIVSATYNVFKLR